MTHRARLFAGVACIAMLTSGALAQAPQTVTVKFLRAAVGSLSEGERITVRAEFSADEGLTEATRIYLRNKGYSRFNVKDPDSDVAFDSMYCHRDSAAFSALIKAEKKGIYDFIGYRGRGQNKEDAFIVESVRFVSDVKSGDEQARPTSYRLTLVDGATSNRTVLVNVELGKPYNMMGAVLILEEEPPLKKGIQVVGPGEQ